MSSSGYRRVKKRMQGVSREGRQAMVQGQRVMLRRAGYASGRVIPQSEWELAAQAMSVPAYFNSRGVEIKAIDIASTTYLFRSPVTTSNVVLLNGVQTGAAFYNRVGSRIEMKNLHIRGSIYNTSTTQTTALRMLVIYDRQPVGTLPVISDILQSRIQDGTPSTSAYSEINLDNRDRFAIIRDMQYYAPSVTNTAGVLTNGPSFPGQDSQQWDVNEFIKLKGLTTHFKSSTAPTAIGDIATGALYCCFVSGIDSVYTASIGFRLRYGDK
jgi:hypothetical protein